jgi:hypothetical protein
MTLTVRLPLRVEQELAQYCVERGLTKSGVVKQALEVLLARAEPASPFELGADLFGAPVATGKGEDVARHTKRLLRERFRQR